MLSEKVLKKVILSAGLAYVAAVGTIEYLRMHEEKAEVAVNPGSDQIEYAQNYVAISNIYERYEHVGFDGSRYCVQVISTPEGNVFMDGADGLCDNRLDTILLKDENIESCEGDYLSNKCIAEGKGFERSIQSIMGILRKWNKKRNSCKESKCYLAGGRSKSMSKKKVE